MDRFHVIFSDPQESDWGLLAAVMADSYQEAEHQCLVSTLEEEGLFTGCDFTIWPYAS